jgi:ABC-type transport system involved in multi-copper enzyme maturation permease subunit
VLVAFVFVLALMVLASWPQGGVIGGSIAVGAGDALVRTSDTLLLGLVLGQIVMLILVVPGVASVALTGEKEANTLEMLYASRLNPSQIVWGKIGVAVTYPIILLLCGLPFAALLVWRGDMRGGDLLWAYALLVVCAVYLSAISLVISALSRQSATALVIAYAAVLCICGVVMVPAAIMLASQTGDSAMALHYVRAVSPVAAALSRFRPQLIEAGGAASLMPISTVYIPVAIIITVICFALVAMKLRKPPSSSEAFGAPAGDETQRSLGRRVMYLLDPKKTPKPFGTGNPIATKERRTSNLAGWRWMIRLFYGALFISLALAVMSLYGGAEYGDLLLYVSQVLVAFQIGLVMLVVPSLTSASVSSEIESGTLEVLRLSPLRGGQIFWGKLLPALMPALLPVLALIPAYGALQFISPGYQVYFLKLLPVVLLAVLFCCILGITCSTFISNTARATVTAYLIAAAITVLPFLAWFAAGAQLSAGVGAAIAFISPLVMGMTQLPLPGGANADVANRIANLYTTHLWVMGGLCIIMIVAARIRLSYLLRHG